MGCNCQFSPELKWECVSEIVGSVRDGSFRTDLPTFLMKVSAVLGSAAALAQKTNTPLRMFAAGPKGGGDVDLDGNGDEMLEKAANALDKLRKNSDAGLGSSTVQFSPGTMMILLRVLMALQGFLSKEG